MADLIHSQNCKTRESPDMQQYSSKLHITLAYKDSPPLWNLLQTTESFRVKTKLILKVPLSVKSVLLNTIL